MIPATQETSITMTISIKLDLVALRKSVRESVLRNDLHADERSAFVFDEDDIETAVRHIVYQKHEYTPDVRVNGYYRGNESLRRQLMDFGEEGYYEELAKKHYRENSVSYKTQMAELNAKHEAERAERKQKEEEAKAEELRVRQNVPEMTKRYDALMEEMEALKRRIALMPTGNLNHTILMLDRAIPNSASKTLKQEYKTLVEGMEELEEYKKTIVAEVMKK
jgi:hypothetical protein